MKKLWLEWDVIESMDGVPAGKLYKGTALRIIDGSKVKRKWSLSLYAVVKGETENEKFTYNMSPSDKLYLWQLTQYAANYVGEKVFEELEKFDVVSLKCRAEVRV